MAIILMCSSVVLSNIVCIINNENENEKKVVNISVTCFALIILLQHLKYIAIWLMLHWQESRENLNTDNSNSVTIYDYRMIHVVQSTILQMLCGRPSRMRLWTYLNEHHGKKAFRMHILNLLV